MVFTICCLTSNLIRFKHIAYYALDKIMLKEKKLYRFNIMNILLKDLILVLKIQHENKLSLNFIRMLPQKFAWFTYLDEYCFWVLDHPTLRNHLTTLSHAAMVQTCIISKGITLVKVTPWFFQVLKNRKWVIRNVSND